VVVAVFALAAAVTFSKRGGIMVQEEVVAEAAAAVEELPEPIESK